MIRVEDVMGKEIMKAKAEIIGAAIGTAEFTEIEKGTQKYVKIKINVKGDPNVFTTGEHAVHIHEFPVCQAPDFKSAGGHFDPGPAGNTDPDINHPYHMGDLPNMIVNENGEGNLDAISTRITLSSGPLSIMDNANGGSSLMIHQHHDPYMGGAHGSGVSGGPRLCCGVIKVV